MRNPKRIPEFLKEVEKSWSKYPDWRFGQWFINVISGGLEGADPWYPEEDELVKIINKFK